MKQWKAIVIIFISLIYALSIEAKVIRGLGHAQGDIAPDILEKIALFEAYNDALFKKGVNVQSAMNLRDGILENSSIKANSKNHVSVIDKNCFQEDRNTVLCEVEFKFSPYQSASTLKLPNMTECSEHHQQLELIICFKKLNANIQESLYGIRSLVEYKITIKRRMKNTPVTVHSKAITINGIGQDEEMAKRSARQQLLRTYNLSEIDIHSAYHRELSLSYLCHRDLEGLSLGEIYNFFLIYGAKVYRLSDQITCVSLPKVLEVNL